MPTVKQAAIAAAVVAIWSAGPVLAQTATRGGMSGPAATGANLNDRPGERAAAVIRAIETEDAPITSAQPVDVTELARARAAGEWQTTERGAAIQVERLQLDEPVRSGAAMRGTAAGRVSARSADRLQMVRVDGDSTDRTKTAPINDAQRYREQARYDSAKKQRDAAGAAAARERAASAVRGTQSKAEIAWSPPERQDYRTAREGDEPTLY